MPYLTLSQLEQYVDSAVRKRGEGYARAGQVTLGKRRGLGPVQAVVLGSVIYDVRVGADGKGLWADCTCPYFEGESGVCKHIWATLMECAAKRIEFAGRVDALRPNDPLDGKWFHRNVDDVEEEDDEEDEEDNHGGEDDESDFEDLRGSSRLINRWPYNFPSAPQGNVVPMRPKLTVPVRSRVRGGGRSIPLPSSRRCPGRRRRRGRSRG